MTHQIFLYNTEQEHKETVGGGGYKIKPFLCKVEENQNSYYNPKLHVDFIQHDWTVNDKYVSSTSTGFPYVDLETKATQNYTVDLCVATIARWGTVGIIGTAHGGSVAANDMLNIGNDYYGGVNARIQIFFGNKKMFRSDPQPTDHSLGIPRIYHLDKEAFLLKDTDENVIFRFDTSGGNAFTTHANLWLYIVNLVLFSQRPNVIKVFWLKLHDGEKVIRDFIPAVNLLGEVGFYCLASDKFYKSPTPVPLTAGPRTPVWPKSKPYEE